MEMNQLQVQMFGSFVIRQGEQVISDNDNRSHKIWLLLAYLIYRRRHSISQQDLTDLLWGTEMRSSNPLNALKTMFHRARATLDALSPNAGHTLILCKNGVYSWNIEPSLRFDVEDFAMLCRAGDADTDDNIRLEHYQKALKLYQGDFLPKLSSEPWVLPIATYYHELFVRVALDTIRLLEERAHIQDAVTLCRQAVQIEPYQEALYQHLIEDLLLLNEQREAAAVYETMSELLFSNFGVMPSDELRALYRKAVRTVNDHAVSMGTIREQLREEVAVSGAMICDYDFFKILYHAEARSIPRSGNAVHITLLSVTSEDGGVLAKRSLDRVMENLQGIIRSNLRKGDIASRCSISQYIIMLPQANYENSCQVSERVIKAFCRQYPHSPARLHYSVQPLEPMV